MSPVDWVAETARVVEQHDAAVREVGLGEAWDHMLAIPHGASRSVLLGTLGAIATYLRETGFTAGRT